MLKLKDAFLDSLIERLVFLAAHEECEAIQDAYLDEQRRVEAMRAASGEAGQRTAEPLCRRAVLD